MHGQKRSEYKSRLLNPEAASKLATKAQQWNALSHELLSQRRRLFDPSPSDSTNANPPSPKILLTLTEKMLTVNPDPSHLWNIRREMLLRLIEHGSTKFDLQPELQLTAHCLKRNPKAYASWFHRKWSIAYFLSSGSLSDVQSNETALVILQSELDLCAQFLMMDERNFHCWNYRRFVAAVLGAKVGEDMPQNDENEMLMYVDSPSTSYNGAWSSWAKHLFDTEEPVSNEVLMGAQIASDTTIHNIQARVSSLSRARLNDLIISEWDFTTSKIQDNFSNGSAFHYRSKLLPIVLESRLGTSDQGTASNTADCLFKKQNTILTLAREEWEEILLNAIFTEPDDQTPWWYHRFIVSWATPSLDLKDLLGHEYSVVIENYETLLYDMADSLRELLEIEKENSVDGEVNERDESKGVKCKWAYLGLHLVLSSLQKVQTGNDSELQDEARECLHALVRIDPCRSQRYKMLANEV